MEKKNLKNYWEVTTEEIVKMFASAEYGEMTILSQLYEDGKELIDGIKIENVLIKSNMLIDYVAYIKDEALDELKKIEEENPVIFTFENRAWEWKEFGDGYKLTYCDDIEESIMETIKDLKIDPEILE